MKLNNGPASTNAPLIEEKISPPPIDKILGGHIIVPLEKNDVVHYLDFIKKNGGNQTQEDIIKKIETPGNIIFIEKVGDTIT